MREKRQKRDTCRGRGKREEGEEEEGIEGETEGGEDRRTEGRREKRGEGVGE